MNRVKLSDNLYLDEYIPEELYKSYASKPHILRGLIDDRIINADQKLRNVFGSVIINNWWSGGDRNWSGLRTPDSPYFSATSQHSFGRASDKLFKHDADDVREYIKQEWRKLGITCVEADVSWLHSDVRWWNRDELLIVKP